MSSSDETTGIDPDRKRWMNDRLREFKSDTVRVVNVADVMKEKSLGWGRKFIKRKDLLTGIDAERGYLIAVCGLIDKYHFTAEMLQVTEAHFAEVVCAGKILSANQQ